MRINYEHGRVSPGHVMILKAQDLSFGIILAKLTYMDIPHSVLLII
jgi:hypothetical protein